MTKTKNPNLCNDIKTLDLEESLIKILLENDIKTVENLWVMNRKKLKEIGIKDSDIKLITIKLQLLGLDLNKKMYN